MSSPLPRSSDVGKPYSLLDRLCIALVGLGVFLALALLIAVVFAAAIMVGGTASH